MIKIELLEEEFDRSLGIEDLCQKKEALDQEICSMMQRKKEIERELNEKRPTLMTISERKRKASKFYEYFSRQS